MPTPPFHLWLLWEFLSLSELFSQALHQKPYLALTKVQKKALISKYEYDVSDHLPIWIRLPRPTA